MLVNFPETFLIKVDQPPRIITVEADVDQECLIDTQLCQPLHIFSLSLCVQLVCTRMGSWWNIRIASHG